jgi:hypothetical protein
MPERSVERRPSDDDFARVWVSLNNRRTAWVHGESTGILFPIKHAGEFPSILGRIPFIIIVEIHPYALCATCLDPLRPFPQFFLGIIMAMPSLFPMEANIDIVRSFNQRIGQFWRTARAKNRSRLTKGGEDLFIPPARVAKFHYVGAHIIALPIGRGRVVDLEEELQHCPEIGLGRIACASDEEREPGAAAVGAGGDL